MKKGLITIILFNFCEEKDNVCQGMYVANILNLTSIYSTNTTASISLLQICKNVKKWFATSTDQL